MKFGVPNGTRLGRPEAGGRGQGCEQIGMVGGREYQGSGFFQHSIFFRSPLAPGVARRRSSASRPVAHLLLCTLPVPLAIFSGSPTAPPSLCHSCEPQWPLCCSLKMPVHSYLGAFPWMFPLLEDPIPNPQKRPRGIHSTCDYRLGCLQQRTHEGCMHVLGGR